MAQSFFERTRGGLIVSCQALPEEPLHSSYIMSRMAYAAMCGGACGIRANSVEDIREIRKTVDLPMIGIIKRVIPGCDAYITPSIQEVDALVGTGVEVIAMDATGGSRPSGRTLAEDFAQIRAKYPDQLFMADCATLEEGVLAQELGFDMVGTTLRGYTPSTKGVTPPDFGMIRELCASIRIPVIAEGGIWRPDQLREALSIPGVHAAVVGSAITRPMEITRRFAAALAR